MILIITLGFLFILTAAVIEFHRKCIAKMEILRNSIDSVQALFLSEIGINLGKDILEKDKNSYDWLGEDWAKEIRISLEEGEINVKIEDENKKLNLNSILKEKGETNTLLLNLAKKIFIELGYSENTIDSFLDWIDEDDIPRVFGAESSYYKSLPTPYSCPNRSLYSIEELNLIKGFTEELLYGNEEKNIPGFLNFVTIDSDNTINVNTCEPILLKSLGFPEEEVNEILLERGEKPLEANYLIKINKEVYLKNKSLIVFKSKFFSVVSVGTTKTGYTRKIRTVFKKDKELVAVKTEYF